MAAAWTLALGLSQPGRVVAAESAALGAQNFLRSVKEVDNQAGGKVWLCGAEQTLRGGLADLPDARRKLVQQQRWLEQRIQQNSQAWEANRQQIATLRAALAQTATQSAERKQLEQQIRELESQAVDPDRLGGEHDVRAHLIQFINTRNALAIDLLAVRRSVPQMEAEYRRLAADREVAAALRTLGEGHRLGPLENYLPQVRRLDEYERLVFTPWLPMYLQSGRVRVGAILNETTPITFTWQAEGGPTILSESMVEAAGLELPTGAPLASLPRGAGRTLTARPLVVPTLRLGQWVLHDVPAHVSTPEAEDLGATITSDTLADYEVTLEPARLQLRIHPR